MMCERCGKNRTTKTIETKDGKKQQQMCLECISIVIRPNTVWQVKRQN